MDHMAHKHRLIFISAGVVHPDNSLGCHGCWRVIEDSHYACKEGCKFFLHDLCAKFPQIISEHPLHPEHRLKMLARPPRYPAECRVCGKRCKGFTYHCMHCTGFDIDLLCAWVPKTVETTTHAHSLSLLPQPAIFSCNACHVEFGNKAFSYICFTCTYWVHLDCVIAPSDLTHARDDHPSQLGGPVFTRIWDNNHPLELVNSWDVHSHNLDKFFKFLGEIQCKICEKDIYAQNYSHDHYFFRCRKSNLYFHVNCIALAALSSSKSVEASLMKSTDPDYAEDSSKPVRYKGHRDVRDRYGGRTKGKLELKHWSHVDHFLKLVINTDEVPRFDRSSIKCNGCKWPLMAPFYCCMNCNFFLHAECAYLPGGILTCVHPHPLQLVSWEGRRRRCSNCSDTFSGFSYKCKQCNYKLDLNCAKIEREIEHQAHEHALYLLEIERPSNKCNACGNSCDKKRTAYFCSICEFYLHVKCASLPFWSRHRFDHHELSLMFRSAENELGEYICDICEDDKRDPNLWFYGCEDCDFAAHVDCIHNQ